MCAIVPPLMSTIVGIDLGTTNCCVAVVEDGKARVIANRQGYTTTPSVIAITEEGQRVVGQLALRQAVTNPAHTVHGAKRLIGRLFDSEEVAHARQHASFTISQGPHGEARIVMGPSTHSIPELSAMLLQEMRVVAEDYLLEPVERAVITVPAYFNDNQRQAVRDAGRIAGLSVERIVNEPTAAAVAYGLALSEASTLAVYDLGGGTFDISIVRVEPGGQFTVVATTGDSYLGGEDFDERLMALLMRAFERDHGLDLREDPVALARVREAARIAKCELSAVEQVDVKLPFVATRDGEPVHLDYPVKRLQLEKLTGDLVTRTLTICEEALRLAALRPTDVDEVILVGGMTRMPAVQRAVREFFEKDPKRGVHPDEVVALGAAEVGYSIAHGGESIQLEDVTAHSLGIMTAGGGFDALIEMNTGVPVQRREVFGTSRDDQTTVKIVVLQGESEQASENEALGRFALTGLREAPAGEIEVEVTFTIDEDGLFSVGARDLETGEERVVEVLATSGLDDEEIAAMMADSADYLAERRELSALEAARQDFQVRIADIRARVPAAARSTQWTPAGTQAVAKVTQALDAVEAALGESDLDALDRHGALLDRVSTMLERLSAEGEAS